MGRSYVGQQFAYARLQCRAAGEAASAVQRRAHCQAAVLQLGLAMDTHAEDLLQSLGLRASVEQGPRFFTRLLRAVEAAGKVSPEARELWQLEEDPNSWLSQLECWRGEVLMLGAADNRGSLLAETSLTAMERESSPQTSEGVIRLVETEAAGFSAELLQDTIDQAQRTIERQRDQGAEY